ncbi:MAG: hypothetical protein HQ596_02635 [Candidatus Saganbacteria bacterium]|nr:hypothetical protein [Candidatus Saganbacteria bacterium]
MNVGMISTLLLQSLVAAATRPKEEDDRAEEKRGSTVRDDRPYIPTDEEAAPLPNQALSLETAKDLAYSALGRPEAEEFSELVDKGVADQNLDRAELSNIWGLTDAQLAGLEAYNIIWSDGLNVRELHGILRRKQTIQGEFMELLRGTGELSSGKSKEDLFAALWQTAVQGKLTLTTWNKLMKEYGLRDLKMNEESFRFLMGGQDDFSHGLKVEGIAEFCTAVHNLLLTAQMNVPPSPRYEDFRAADQERQVEYFQVMVRYSRHRNFSVLYMKNSDTALRGALGAVSGDYDVMGATGSQLMAEVQSGRFGEYLQLKAEEYNIQDDWDAFILVLLQLMEQALMKDEKEYESSTQYSLQRSKRKKKVASIIEEGREGNERIWGAFTNQLGRLFSDSSDGAQRHLDYDALMRAGRNKKAEAERGGE